MLLHRLHDELHAGDQRAAFGFQGRPQNADHSRALLKSCCYGGLTRQFTFHRSQPLVLKSKLLWIACEGPRRYNEIQRLIGAISQRMLTLTLKGLEEDGLVNRTIYPTIPPRVDYELTPLGRSLLAPLNTLYQWAAEHKPTIEAARGAFSKRAQMKK
jgi:DNA-binding HxlR family transcriptional regulator